MHQLNHVPSPTNFQIYFTLDSTEGTVQKDNTLLNVCLCHCVQSSILLNEEMNEWFMNQWMYQLLLHIATSPHFPLQYPGKKTLWFYSKSGPELSSKPWLEVLQLKFCMDDKLHTCGYKMLTNPFVQKDSFTQRTVWCWGNWMSPKVNGQEHAK